MYNHHKYHYLIRIHAESEVIMIWPSPLASHFVFIAPQQIGPRWARRLQQHGVRTGLEG